MYRVAGECRVDISTTKKTPTLGLHRIAKLLGNENKMNRSSGSSGLYNCGKITSDPFLSANSFARHTQMSSCYQLFETLKSNYKIKILSWSKSLSFYVYQEAGKNIELHLYEEKQSEVILPWLYKIYY